MGSSSFEIRFGCQPDPGSGRGCGQACTRQIEPTYPQEGGGNTNTSHKGLPGYELMRKRNWSQEKPAVTRQIGLQGVVADVVFSPGGSTAASYGPDTKVRVWSPGMDEV